MKVQRIMWGAVIAVLAAVLLTGCPLLFGPPPDDGGGSVKPDLYVESVEPLKDSSNEVVGVRIVFRNNGPEALTPRYAVYFSADRTISEVSDDKVYAAEVTIQGERNKPVDLSAETHIIPYMENNSVEVDTGDYYIGVIVDPDDLIAESDEANNEGTSTEMFPFSSGGGTIAVKVENAVDFNGKDCGFAIVNPGGNPDTDAVAWGQFTIQSGSGSAVAEHENDTGQVDTWYGTDGQSYDIHIFIDADGSGVDDGPTDGDYGSHRENVLLDGNITEAFDAQSDFDLLGPSGDGILDVAIANAGDIPDGTPCGFGVCLEDDEYCSDLQASGYFEIWDGYGYAVAQTDNTDGDPVDWYGTYGTNYVVYVAVDMDGSGLEEGPGPGDLTTSAPFTMEGDLYMEFDAEIDFSLFGAVEVEIYDAHDFYDQNVEVFFAVTHAGVEPYYEENILAASIATANADGYVYTDYLKDYDGDAGGITDQTWLGEDQEEYDLHVWVERDLDDLPYGYADFGEGALVDGPITFLVDNNGYLLIHGDDLWLGGTVFVNVNDEGVYEENNDLESGVLHGKWAYFTVTEPGAMDFDEDVLAQGSFQVIHEDVVDFPDDQYENGAAFELPDELWHYNAPDGTEVKVWVYVDLDNDANGFPEQGDPSGVMDLTIDGNVWADFWYGSLTPYGVY
ncbi:MAG: CARDB domain-containing protein [Spirochaetaceae bacterium]